MTVIVSVSVFVCVTVKPPSAFTGVFCETGIMLNAGVGTLGEVKGATVVIGVVEK